MDTSDKHYVFSIPYENIKAKVKVIGFIKNGNLHRT